MNISRLELFTSKGYRIPTQTTKTISFTIIGSMYRSDRNYGWREDASGYFTIDEKNKIVSCTIDNPGSTYSFDPASWDKTIDYYDATAKLIDEIAITVKIGDKEYKKSFFNEDQEDNIFKYFDITTGMKKEFVRAQSSNERDNAVYTFFIDEVMPKDPEFFLYDFFKVAIEADGHSLDELYPSTRFLGSIEIEPVSAGLAGVETIFILEKQDDGTFKRPKSDGQMLRLQVSSDSNVKFVKYAEEWIDEDLSGKKYDPANIDYSKVYWSNYKVFDLVSEAGDDSKDNEPLVLTIGFLADEEGCYQDLISINTIDFLDDPSKDIQYHNIGYLAVQSTSLGEDERYRTLFANFGIPDPKDYQNVFKDMPIYEEGTDWDFINKKSKQLFLSYSEIFPYVGTYKALINAVKYLGYDDIYFKEWFMHFDGTFESKVAYESIDVSTGITLQSKLKRAGVTLDEFIEWKKLNQLSLVYKINEEDELYDDVDYWKKNSSDWERGSMRFEVPSTKPVYSYLNLEVLTKLFALKEWLEKYILNVNCQIIDVTGEGVYFTRTKELGYTTGYQTFTEEKEEHLSPIFDYDLSDLQMHGSNASICCTLKEIKYGMTFDALSDKKIKTYINKIFEAFDDSSLNEMKKVEWYDTSVVGFPSEDYCIIGKPSSISTPFEEIQYELTVDTSCGTMKNGVGYWAQDPSTGEKTFVDLPLLVLDNEMFVFKNEQNEIEFSEPPIIRIKSGQIRKSFGRWEDNIKYTIYTYFDTKSRHTRYSFKSEDTGFHREYNDYVTLYPRFIREENGDKKWTSKLKYTSDNKYNVPMLVIENYDTYDHFFLEEKKSELAKEYLDTSTSISNDFDNVTGATEAEMENVASKREYLHKKAIEKWNNDFSSYKSVYDSSTFVDGFNKYILILNEGFIENKEVTQDKDVEYTSKIVFEPVYKDNNGEQSIFTEYTYRSKMNPCIEFDSSLYESRYQSYKNEYYDKINELDLLIQDASNFQGDILEDPEYQYAIKAAEEQERYYQNKSEETEQDKIDYIAIYNTTSGKGKALEEYLAWMILQSSSGESRFSNLATITHEDLENRLVAIKQRFIAEYESLKSKAYTDLLENLLNLKNECFVFYKDKTFNVHHFGDYELTVKGLDGYNTPFVRKGNDTATVYGMHPSIFILDSNEDLNEGVIDTSYLSIGGDPTLWPSYRRPISKTGITDSSIEYLNWSYILDTPKEGDFLKLSNLTERVNKIVNTEPGLSGDQIKIILNDENPQHQNLFYTGALVKLYFIDRNTNELVNADEQIAGPFIVTGFKQIPYNDLQEEDNNYIILNFSSNYEEFKAVSNDTIELVNIKDIDCYASVVSKMEIGLDNIENNYEDKTCNIKIRNYKNFNNLAFKPEQCVKLEFTQITYVGETPSATGDTTQEIVTERYNSGTTYRIKDAWYDTNDFSEVYVLDGLVNSDLLIPEIYKNNIYNYLSETPRDNIKNIPFKVRCTIAPAHTTYTSYIVQATQDANERIDTGWLTYKDNWYAKDFIDNSFSFTISKFNINDAYRDWFKETSTKSMYIHRDPVSNNTGNNMVVLSEDEDNTYDGDYLKIWDVYVNQSNDLVNDTLIYQVTNDCVPITLNYEGEYHFVLTSIDRYGNKTINKSGGFLKALES